MLDKGEVVEMDKPDVLLANPESHFSHLVESSINASKHGDERMERSNVSL